MSPDGFRGVIATTQQEHKIHAHVHSSCPLTLSGWGRVGFGDELRQIRVIGTQRVRDPDLV